MSDEVREEPSLEEEGSGRGPMSEFYLSPVDVEGLDVNVAAARRRKAAFLRAFAKTGVVSDGLRAAGVSRRLYNEHWMKDPWFRPLRDAALEEASDRFEAEAIRRAVDGVDEPVTYQGFPTVIKDPQTGEEKLFTVKKYSDSLLQTLLKATRPEKYRENIKQTVDVNAASGVLIVPAPVDAESWAKAAKEQQAKFAGNDGEGGEG